MACSGNYCDRFDSAHHVVTVCLAVLIALILLSTGCLVFRAQWVRWRRGGSRVVVRGLETDVAEKCCSMQVHEFLTEVDTRFPPQEVAMTTDAVCVICLQHLEVCQLRRKLPCGHDHHADCLLGWWRHRASQQNLDCPVCRQDVTKVGTVTV